MSTRESSQPSSSMPISPWKELRRSVVYQKFGRSLVEVVYGLPFEKETTFSIKCEPSTVVVVALTNEMNVVLTRQFRPGPDKVLYDLPGGYIDNGEQVVDAARRELLEETGFDASLQYVGKCYYDAYSNAVKHCVVGVGALAKASPNPDAEEQIDVSIVHLADFRKILRNGLLTDVDMGYMALDFLDLAGN